MSGEMLRQAMLKQMGLMPWFPRVALPGAAPSHGYVFDAITPTTDADSKPDAPPESDNSQRTPVVTQIPETLTAIAREAQALTVASRSLTPALAPEHSPPLLPAVGGSDISVVPLQTAGSEYDAGDDEVPAFAFSWFSIDKRLAVLATLPAGEADISRQGRQMLIRILAALSSDFKEVDLQEHCFHWPFADDLGLPSGSRAARQAVDGFVARRLRERPASFLLVLADETPPFLFKPDTSAVESVALSVHRQFRFTMLLTHSLHSMEKNPELKRSAWQAMKVLLDRLNRQAGSTD